LSDARAALRAAVERSWRFHPTIGVAVAAYLQDTAKAWVDREERRSGQPTRH
jgi:hypothetical protein